MRSVILAGGPADRPRNAPDGLPRPFWPLVMRPLVCRLIDQLVATGVEEASVCANGQTSLYTLRLESEDFGLKNLRFCKDPLPRGPAGCIKDNEAFLSDAPFLVAGAACWLCDPAESLIERHRHQRNKLTVFCMPGTKTPSGIYAFDPEVLAHIPPVGYCDIKEQLVPRLLDRGLRVAALPLHRAAAEVVSIRSYLLLHRRVLALLAEQEANRNPGQYEPAGQGVWISRSARVSPRARLFGPVIVGPHASVADRAVIIGPVAIGPRAVIDEDAIVTESVVWEGVYMPRSRSATQTVVAPRSTVSNPTPSEVHRAATASFEETVHA
jgi:NDP-sugar pyrophosphorylase family protein